MQYLPFLTHSQYPTTSVAIGRRVGQLPELIEYHNEAVRELERVLVRYLHGGKIAKNRPTITIGGFLGIGGTKKDAIDFYTYVDPWLVYYAMTKPAAATSSRGLKMLSKNGVARLTSRRRKTMVRYFAYPELSDINDLL